MQRTVLEEKSQSLAEVVRIAHNELESIKMELDKTNSHSEQLTLELTQRYQKSTELIKRNENLQQTISQANNWLLKQSTDFVLERRHCMTKNVKRFKMKD